MSRERGKMCQIESLRLSVNELLTSVGEEILCVLETQQSDVCQLKLNVRVFVLERLSAAAEFTCNLFQREMETLETLLERQDKLLDVILPRIKLHRPDFLHLPVYKKVPPEQQERSPSLVQGEPEPPKFKRVQKELLQREEEAAGSTFTLIAVKGEGEDENREMEPVASTSTQHMKTQADVEECGTSQPTSGDQLFASHCSESDTEHSDEWEDTREGPSDLNTLKSHKTQHAEGQRLALATKLSQDLKALKQKKYNSMRNRAGGEKIFPCTECGKMFNLKANLKQHTKIHSGLKPFTCTICDKVFSLKGGLKTHTMIHTGEKPYTCTFCGKSCGRMGHLKTHTMIHTGEKPYTCIVCGKSFGQSNNLKTHMTIHTGEKPYICTVCGKGCNHLSHLKTHMRTHTGDKPYTCTVCDERFTQSHVLKRHMKTHTAERNFTCTVCDQRFSRSDNLKVHMMTHAEGKTL